MLLLYYDVVGIFKLIYGEVLFDMLFVCIESSLFLTSSSSTSMPCCLGDHVVDRSSELWRAFFADSKWDMEPYYVCMYLTDTY